MTDHNETSYYEIALTNRQVMVAFVLLLGAVLLAFLSGVWLGKGEPQLPTADEQIAALPEEAGGSDIEELQFFSEGAPAEGAVQDAEAKANAALDKPDLGSLRGEDRGGQAPSRPSTLAQDVGSPGANRDATPPPSRPAGNSTSPAARPAAASASTEPQEGFIVQVFSTREEGQAKKVQKSLAASGYPAYLSPVDVNRQTMYRVRVGPYRDRGRADKVGAEVKRKFQYDTWITAATN